jgi:nitrogen fixation-related uncharacterized protein
MNEAIWMMMLVSGGFAALALLGLWWSLSSGQWKNSEAGALLPLSDDSEDAAMRGV